MDLQRLPWGLLFPLYVIPAVGFHHASYQCQKDFAAGSMQEAGLAQGQWFCFRFQISAQILWQATDQGCKVCSFSLPNSSTQGKIDPYDLSKDPVSMRAVLGAIGVRNMY